MPSPVATRIFLVEDDPDIAFMYNDLFTKAGYEVTLLRDGDTAWNALTTQERPDLLLLDVVLPKKDGFEILRDLRKHPTLHNLKVVLLTNLAQEVDKKEGEKLGATDYIVKAHITPHDLLAKVQDILKSP